MRRGRDPQRCPSFFCDVPTPGRTFSLGRGRGPPCDHGDALVVIARKLIERDGY
jgi:hypothetical protein